jgi:hypothetical protein
VKRHHIQPNLNKNNRHDVKKGLPRIGDPHPFRDMTEEEYNAIPREYAPAKPSRKRKYQPLLLVLLAALLIVAGVVWGNYAAAHRDLDDAMERSRQIREEQSRQHQERTKQILRKAGVLD